MEEDVRVGLDPSLLQIEMVALGEVGIPFAGLDAALNQIASVRLEDIRFHFQNTVEVDYGLPKNIFGHLLTAGSLLVLFLFS